MGLRDDIQTDLAEAFNTDLADAIFPFAGEYLGPGVRNPITEETTAQPVFYSGRGVLDSYDSGRIDSINIKVGDVLLICLANETTDIPAVGHKISVEDLLTGQQAAYRVVNPGIDPAKAHYEIQLRK